MLKTSIAAPVKIIEVPMKATASADGIVQPDLLYIESILVSTGENANDDVFLPSEMWAARKSPIFKPMDWEHNTGSEITDRITSDVKHRSVIDDNQIVGVMYDTAIIDGAGNQIDDATADQMESPPENFHILNKGVVYKYLFPSLASRIAKDASAGKLFVSMEAWFKSYDYKVGNKIVARNTSTSFLDNHLRANGGIGNYKGEKVSRILRGITFGGVGFVANPANKDSIIRSVTNASEESNNSGELSIAKEAQAMSDGNDMNVKILELEKSLATKNAELASLKSESAKLTATVDTFSTALAAGAENIAKLLGDEVVSAIASAKPTEYMGVLHNGVSALSAKAKESAAKLAEASAKIDELEKSIVASDVAAKVSELFASVEQTDAMSALKARVSAMALTLDEVARAAYLEDTKALLGLAAKPPFMKKDEEKKDMDEEEDAEAAILDSVKTSASVMPAGTPDAAAPNNMVERMSSLATLLLAAGKNVQGGN